MACSPWTWAIRSGRVGSRPDTCVLSSTRVPISQPAQVAELEDAVDLKSIVRKGVWVRVPPWALGGRSPVGLTRAGRRVPAGLG
jgi:hypothetical protein